MVQNKDTQTSTCVLCGKTVTHGPNIERSDLCSHCKNMEDDDEMIEGAWEHLRQMNARIKRRK